MQLKTERLVLREITAKDTADIVQHCKNLEISQWLGLMPHPYTKKNAKEFLTAQRKNRNKSPRTSYTLAINLKGSTKLIGMVGMHDVSRFNGTGKLGYWLAKEHWRKGYMTEAVKAMCKFGFEKLKLRRIHADVYEGNPSSGKVLEKAGFTREAFHRQLTRSKATGKVHDVHHYAFLRDEWQKT